ncbi:MAG: fimbria major subunit [Bacteroidales bacterium]|nr:fimbria major subunit [Bacteroidales bacterium]
MKKIYLLTALIILGIAGLPSCVENDVSQQSSGSQLTERETTQASFTLIPTPSTRAVTDFRSDTLSGSTADEATQANLVASDLKLLIFDVQSDVLEIKQNFTTTSTITVLVKVGPKKIFVIGNVASLADKVGGGTFNSKYTALTVGTTTLTQFRAMNFDAGVPQLYSINKASSSRTFDLHVLAQPAGGGGGLPVSNTEEITYDIEPDISAAQSQVPPGSNSGSSANNHFNIYLVYMTAKAKVDFLTTAVGNVAGGTAFVYMGGPTPPTGEPPYYPHWTVKNLAKHTHYVQHFSGSPQSYNYNFTGNNAADFAAEFDTGNNLDRRITAAIPTADPTDADTYRKHYVVTPENNSSKGNAIQRGQSSFYAIRLTFLPKEYIEDVNGGMSNNTFSATISPTATTFSNPMTEAPKSYLYLRKGIGLSQYLQAETYWKDTVALFKAYWHEKHYNAMSNTWTGSPTQVTQARSEFLADIVTVMGNGNRDEIYFVYKGWNYYRIDIGEALGGGGMKYGVLRGNKYYATISNVTGPGYPEERYLYERPTDPVESYTYLTVDISVSPWVWAFRGVVLPGV